MFSNCQGDQLVPILLRGGQYTVHSAGLGGKLTTNVSFSPQERTLTSRERAMGGARCSWRPCWGGWTRPTSSSRPGPTPPSWTASTGRRTWWPGTSATTAWRTSSSGQSSQFLVIFNFFPVLQSSEQVPADLPSTVHGVPEVEQLRGVLHHPVGPTPGLEG